jgi:HEAT repeat protein
MMKKIIINNPKQSRSSLDSLIEALANKDAFVRQKARKSLVALGKPAVSSLIRTLQSAKVDHVRWEAAKTLGAIGDPRAIPSLVRALEDTDPDVTWLAAEALITFKKVAWPSLLRALVKDDTDSVLLRQGAHHVLRNQKENGFNELLKVLIKALESNTASESIPFAVSNILKRMKVKS